MNTVRRKLSAANASIPYVKICCISSIAEADLAIAAGASAIGLVSAMPSGPGVIDESTITKIIAHVNGRVDTFLLTALVTANEIVAQHERCPASTLQLVNDVDLDEIARLRKCLPSTTLIKVIHVADAGSVAEAKSYEAAVDAILLDTGRKSGVNPQFGGTGLTHDWSISRAICETLSVPILLAGGLRASNVREAIRRGAPFGVDVCSGVRTNDRLDREKLEAFIHDARSLQ